jgi:hypothetical protein
LFPRETTTTAEERKNTLAREKTVTSRRPHVPAENPIQFAALGRQLACPRVETKLFMEKPSVGRTRR